LFPPPTVSQVSSGFRYAEYILYAETRVRLKYLVSCYYLPCTFTNARLNNHQLCRGSYKLFRVSSDTSKTAKRSHSNGPHRHEFSSQRIKISGQLCKFACGRSTYY
jgi:hypothetical protein